MLALTTHSEGESRETSTHEKRKTQDTASLQPRNALRPPLTLTLPLPRTAPLASAEESPGMEFNLSLVIEAKTTNWGYRQSILNDRTRPPNHIIINVMLFSNFRSPMTWTDSLAPTPDSRSPRVARARSVPLVKIDAVGCRKRNCQEKEVQESPLLSNLFEISWRLRFGCSHSNHFLQSSSKRIMQPRISLLAELCTSHLLKEPRDNCASFQRFQTTRHLGTTSPPIASTQLRHYPQLIRPMIRTPSLQKNCNFSSFVPVPY